VAFIVIALPLFSSPGFSANNLFVFAGLPHENSDNDRVPQWINDKFTLHSNPGFYPDQAIICEISGSHGSEYEDNGLLGCCAM
jgi:hypothetical protein